jgi:transcriptional regulator with XRE-family HTH domain
MFANILKNLRNQNKKTQQNLADFLGITRQGYAKYENEDAEPDINTLKKIADFYGVSIDYLLGRSNHPKLTEEADKEFDSRTLELIKIVESLPDDLREQFWKNAELMTKHLQNK